jgi:hypothetical protein
MIKQCNQHLHRYSIKITSETLLDCWAASLLKLMTDVADGTQNNCYRQ